MQTLSIPNVIPNKHTEKVKSNEKRPGKSKVVLSVFSVDYKIKIKFTFYGEYQIYLILCGEIISIFIREHTLVNNTDFFHCTP